MSSYLPDALSASGQDSFTKPNPSIYRFIRVQFIVHNEVRLPQLIFKVDVQKLYRKIRANISCLYDNDGFK